MRYVSPNETETEKSIARQYNAIAASKNQYEAFNESIILAESLTIMEREGEAVKILSPYVKQHPAEATDEDLAWLYLNYATANQYNRKPAMAERYFRKAIHICSNNELQSVEHFVYHPLWPVFS